MISENNSICTKNIMVFYTELRVTINFKWFLVELRVNVR